MYITYSFEMAIVKLGYIISFSLLTRVYCANFEYKTFRCGNGTYISDKLVGDGRPDCVNDGADERFVKCDRSSDKDCQSHEFFHSEFKFIRNGCKSLTGRCNTIKDCFDGSDESNCGDEINTDDCSLKKGKYFCLDGLKCLDLNYTCDGYCNCFDCSDEGNHCLQANITEESSHKVCFQTLNESHCCSEYNSVCKECASNKVCDHKCVQFANQTGCFCDENYVGVPGSQNSNCQLSNTAANEKVLLYSTYHVINAIKFATRENFTVKTTDNPSNYNLTAITAFQDYVYYATREAQPLLREVAYYVKDEDNKITTIIGYSYHPANVTSIFKTSISSNKTYEIFKFHFDDVEITSLAIDWVTRNIYLTTELSLSVYSNDGSIYKDLRYGRTKFINLASRFGLMFYAQLERDSSHTSTLIKSSMDGSEVNALFPFDFKVEVMTVDESSERVYWYYSSYRTIHSVNFDGRERQTLPSELPISGPGIYFEREIFFILGNIIVSLHKDTKTRTLRFPVPKELLYGNRFNNTEQNLRLLYVYNPLLQRVNIQNPCPASCTGLCMTRPSLSEGVLNYTCWNDESKKALLANSDEGWFTTSWILIISAIVLIIVLAVGILVYLKIRKRNPPQSD